jgi:SAM-dependent methyltransferase
MNKSCPQCKSETHLFFSTADYNRKTSKETFNYYRCPNCRLIYLFPIPNNLGEYYPKEYYSFPSSIEQLAQSAEPERYKIDIVKQFSSHGRLLEIGPASGNFTYLAKKAGFEVEAIEMDANCCSFLREVIGIKAMNSIDPSAALIGAEKYDVITLWHVIEHLPDPWVTLKSIADGMVSGGILVIAAPNPDAFQFRILGRFWPHVDAPRHLELIPLPLLANHVKSLGLTAVWATTTDKGTLGWNIFGWEVFFANISNQRLIKRRFSKLGKLISKIVRPIERMTDRGSAYTAVFKKE